MIPRLSSHTDHHQSLWGLSWMCFFWGLASVMVLSLVPTFLKDVLGASHKQIGWIEGVAVSLAFLAKIIAGVSSDYFHTRRPLIVWGSVLTILGKMLFAISFTTMHIFFARSLDRLIKGWRSAPTEAMIADLSSQEMRGTAYGAKQSLHILGGFFGGVIASLTIHLTGGNYRLVFWMSVIPASLALLILIKFVKESESLRMKKAWTWQDVRTLPPLFWTIIATTFFLMLARFSTTFLNLRLKEVGWSLAFIPLITCLYEIIHAAVAWPAGRLADRYNKNSLFLIGIIVLTLADLVILYVGGKWGIFFGIILAASHMGLTQGLISTIISQHASGHLIGTAFSIYYFTTGLSVLMANGIAGHLSHYFQSSLGAFAGGAFFSFISFMLYLRARKQ